MIATLKRSVSAFRAKYSQLAESISTQETHILNIALFAWLVIVVMTVLHHEMWRDEVRALAMALEPESILGLFKTLRNEGHPVLWYVILRTAYQIWPTPVVLQMASILIAFLAVALFLKKSPFPLVVRLLFIFGVLPLVEYSVSARNYGISMLLFFLFAIMYIKPNRKSYIVGAIIALLANTNYLAMMFAGILVAVWAVEELSNSSGFRPFLRRFILPATPAILGIIVALFTILMDKNSSQAPPEAVFAKDYLSPLLNSAIHPGLFFKELMPYSLPVRDTVVFGLLAGLLVSPLYAGSLYISIFLYNLFSSTIMGPTLRHQGVLFILILTFYWIASVRNCKKSKRSLVFMMAVYLVFVPLFCHQITFAKKKITEEIDREISSSAALGKFINTNWQLRDAVIIGDPDTILGSLMYYVKNRIYYVRENRYGRYERYVKVPKESVTLRDLLARAEMIRNTEQVPVLILLKHFDIPEYFKNSTKTYTTILPYGRRFDTTLEEVREFSDRTVKIAEFNNALCDENYEVFLLPGSTDKYFRAYGDYRQRLVQPVP
jgi:hypothetical protein